MPLHAIPASMQPHWTVWVSVVTAAAQRLLLYVYIVCMYRSGRGEEGWVGMNSLSGIYSALPLGVAYSLA